MLQSKWPVCPYTGGASNLGVVPIYQILLAAMRLASSALNLLTALINLLTELVKLRDERRDPTANSTITVPEGKHFRQK